MEIFRRLQNKQENVEDSDLLDESGSRARSSASSEVANWQCAVKKRKRAKDDKGLKGVKILKGTSAKPKPAQPCTGPPPGLGEGHGAKDTPIIEEKSSETPRYGVSGPSESLLDARDGAPDWSTATRVPHLGLAGYSSEDEE